MEVGCEAKAERHAIPDTCGDEGISVPRWVRWKGDGETCGRVVGIEAQRKLRATHLRVDERRAARASEAPLTADGLVPPPPTGWQKAPAERAGRLRVSRGRGGGDPFRWVHVVDATDTDDHRCAAPREGPRCTSARGSVDGRDPWRRANASSIADRGARAGAPGYASCTMRRRGRRRLLGDDTTAVVDRSSAATGKIGWRAGAGTAAGDECRPVSSPARRRRARRAPCPASAPSRAARGAAAAEAPAQLHREGRWTWPPRAMSDEESASKLTAARGDAALVARI